jgi:CheY-like chemotaxis protein
MLLSEIDGLVDERARRGGSLAGKLLELSDETERAGGRVDLNAAVVEITEVLGRIRRRISIDLEVSDSALIVETQRSTLDHVLLDLFLAAAGSVGANRRLQVRTMCVHEEEGTPRALFLIGQDVERVLDRGVEALLAQTFDSRLSVELSLAASTIAAIGGRLGVVSTLGVGPTYLFEVPCAEPVQPQPATEDKPLTARRILAVDDDPLVLDVCTDMLTRGGYEVQRATSGAEAVRHLEASAASLDLVLLDVIMPGIDGVEVFRRLRELSPELPVLFSSGYRKDYEVEVALSKPSCDFIQKPYSMVELLQKVEKLVGSPAAFHASE